MPTLKQRLGLGADPLFLMDGSAYIYRGYFANRHMQRSDGFPTNSLVVVTRVLLRILREEGPSRFVFVKDGRGKNFRHELYPQYKANRDAMPEDLVVQIEPIQRMVQALGLRHEVTQGVEADDCIASLAARFSKDMPVVIVSGDKDLKQCLAPNVFMWDPGFREEKLVRQEDFIEETGIAPSLWPDVQALMGDSSDNIPGVPGIGPKTALQIFAQCPGLESIRDNFASLPGKMQDKLRDHLQEMFMWRELTRLRLDACPHIGLDDVAVRPLDVRQCQQLADEFELFALRREMLALAKQQTGGQGSLDGIASIPTAANAAAGGSGRSRATSQISLFDIADTPAATHAEEVADVGALPSCAGKSVALIWPDGPGREAHLAVQDEKPAEYAWAGDLRQLCLWLADAGRLVLADLKSLLVAAPFWREFLSAPESPQCFDLGLAAYLISPEEGDYGWARLAGHWGASLKGREQGAAVLALELADSLSARLERDGLLPLHARMEMPLVYVLANMELAGIRIDSKAFGDFLGDVQAELDALTADVFAKAGKTFNIRSAQQLGEVLFADLGLPSPRKTRGGQASTSQQILEKLAGSHPVVDSILHFRKLEKMRSTYLEPLPRLMDREGRIHTTFNQKATATGRLSSSNPNLQNIPVRGPLGKRMRSCFVARQGCLLVSADYSQVELRVLAHMSQDQALLAAFRAGEDIHARTAALVYDLAPEDVTPDQRRNAKTINFGLIYGMGAQKLAQELKISTADARDFIERYFSRLTGLRMFYEQVEQQAREDGFVTTLGGRRRLLPDMRSGNGQAFALARRQAINTVIQGSAADIIKLAMLAVAGDDGLARMQARMLLQVHDELLLEVPASHAQAAAQRVAALMEEVAPGGARLDVPLLVDWGTGENWGSAH